MATFRKCTPRDAPHAAAAPLSRKRGFSLLELAIVITIIAIVTGISIDMGLNMIQSVKIVANEHKLNVIQQALQAYRLGNERLPCPADAALATTSPYYGYEAGTLSGNRWTPDMGSCMTNGTYTTTTASGYTSGVLTGTATNSVAANYNVLIPKGANATNIATNTYVAEGAVPVKALGLPDSFMYDAWGHKFAYAVWAPDTAENAFLNYGVTPSCGAITVNDASGNHRTQSAVYALVSFGPDGHGAYLKDGSRYFSGSDNGDNSGAAGQPPVAASEWQNCHCNATANTTPYEATYVQKRWTEDPNDSDDTFDDNVRFKMRWQMMDQHDTFSPQGLPCTPGFRIDGYFANQHAGSMGVYTADINDDGIPDLIIPTRDESGLKWYVYVIFGRRDDSFPNPLVLNDPTIFNGTNGFVITNFKAGWISGAWLNIAVGDLNGDGIDDLVLAPDAAGGIPVSVVYGMKKDTPWPSTVDVQALFNSSSPKGTTLNLAPNNSVTYYPVTIADINNDTINDLIVDMPDMTINGAATTGQEDVIFGKSAMPSSLSYSDLTGGTAATGGNGFIITGDYNYPSEWGWPGPATGSTIATGDFNGDKVQDIALGVNTSVPKRIYMVWGHDSSYSWPADVDLTNLAADGSQGVTISLPCGEILGRGAFAAGDLNGDDIDDLTLAENYSCYTYATGAQTIIYGTKSWPASNTYSFSPNGTNGVVIETDYNWSGDNNRAIVTDLNNDDKKDLVFGGNPTSRGALVTVYNKSSWSSGKVDTTTFSGSDGWMFEPTSGLWTSNSLLAAGDVTGDGVKDIIFGSPTANSGAGATYIIYGKTSGMPAVFDDSSTYQGVNWTRIDGATAGDASGVAATTLDINHDGVDDAAITAPDASPNGVSNAGSVYVVWGHKGAWKSTMNFGDF